MANIKDLKKDINNVLGDIIEAVYIVEASNGTTDSKEGSAIIDKTIATFDELITKVNDRSVEARKKHLKTVREELETKATALVQEVNSLG